MNVPETRLVKIEGTDVTVAVSNADEARHALKELRLVKREALRHRRELAKAEKAANAAVKSSKGRKPRRPARRNAEKSGPVIDNPLSYVWHSLAAVASAASGTDENKSQAKTPPPKSQTTGSASLKREIARTDEVISGIESCMLQIETRLLAEKAPRRDKPAAKI